MALLDKQLEAGIHGDFEKGWLIAQQLEKETPTCQRAAFNRGWYLLRQGKLLEGHNLLDYGRSQNVFGNRHIGSKQPIWNGEEGTVLLNLEGGLGDQIKSYRFAFDLRELGNRVIISCSPELAQLFAENFPVVQPEVPCGVYHDYWIPSMSVQVPLKLEFHDLSGESYIRRIGKSEGKIGVNWTGNPRFEHQQHRLFDQNLMFNMLEDYDCISLQKDDIKIPFWMEQQPLDTWRQTREQISRCDLVISSCTSVAHLAGAMGIETWIVVPILPYYLWALPGNTTPHYDSVTLFRQEKYGNWNAPFKTMTEQLKLNLKQKVAA